MAKLPTLTFVASIRAWADELGIKPELVRTRLRGASIDTGQGAGIRARDVFRAMSAHSGLEVQLLEEEVRYKREAANVKERQRRKLDSELLPAAEVELAWTSAVVAARQIIWQSALSESDKRRVLKTLSEIVVDGSATDRDETTDDDADGDDAHDA